VINLITSRILNTTKKNFKHGFQAMKLIMLKNRDGSAYSFSKPAPLPE
jgi:hypothetical protein